MKKKLLSLLLVLIMALSLLPTAVFAETEAETCQHEQFGYNSVEGGHQAFCWVCRQNFGGVLAHNWDEHGVCPDCKEVTDSHQHEAGDNYAASDGGHMAVCKWCQNVFGYVLDHVWDEHGMCKLCPGKSEDHVCEAGGYRQEENGHSLVCKWCYSSIGEVAEHTYNNTTDYKCTACGYIDLSRHVCTPDDYYESVEGGHQAYCRVCNNLCGEVQKHKYNKFYVCSVCSYADPDLHEHEFFDWYQEAADASPENPGHYKMCSLCFDPMSEVLPHNFLRNCCTDCGAASADHTHVYREIYDDTVCMKFCAICYGGDQATDKPVTHKYKDGVCEDCGYLDPTLVPASIKLTVNANKQMVISLTFAGGRTMDLTVTDFESYMVDRGYSFGNFFTEEGVILGTKYGLYLHEDNRYSVVYGDFSTQGTVSNDVDCDNWWNVLSYAERKGIALPSVRFADGVWQVTGTGFDGKPNSMTLTVLEADELFGHAWVYVEGVAATCGTAGVAAHYRCTSCGRCITDDENENVCTESELVIPATGKHEYENGKCKACGFVNPVADVKKDDLKTDTKNDKIITDNKGLVIKSDSKIDEAIAERIKDAVVNGRIAVAVDDGAVSDLDKATDGGLQALNKAVENTSDAAKKEELKKVADTLNNARKDTGRKNVQIKTVLDVALQLMQNNDVVGQIIELPRPVTVQMSISEELYAALQGKVVVILRSHTDASGNVTVDELPATLGGEKGNRYVSFETDKASTFALMSYEKVAAPETPVGPAVKTGDAGITLWLIALPVTALAAAAVVIGKKKSEAR